MSASAPALPASDTAAPTVELLTFGCRLNSYESEVMRRLAPADALRPLAIVNTCAVTSEAERQARQAIRRLHRERPEAQIVVTGCAATIAPEAWADLPGVTRVVANEAKLRPQTWAAAADLAETAHHLLDEDASRAVDGIEGRSRGIVQVQQGCDHRCTFCIIPYGRGPSTSLPLGVIVEQARRMTEAGVPEIVLTGVDITSYGPDLPGQPSLGQAIRRLLAQVPGLTRLRLSSLDPVEIDEDLWRLIGEEPRLLPHLHLSIQAGDDMVLKRMKRRHSRADALAACQRARILRPAITLGADLIAGFPTETDAMAQNTLNFVEEAGLTFLHVFPYSPRPGTPAARMPQVDGTTRKARGEALRLAGARQLRRHLEGLIGSRQTVLVESDTIGRTDGFARVRFTGGAPAPLGGLAQVRIAGIDPAGDMARAA